MSKFSVKKDQERSQGMGRISDFEGYHKKSSLLSEQSRLKTKTQLVGMTPINIYY